MADADIIARFQLKTNEFSGPLRSTLDDLNARTRASGAQIKSAIGGALSDVTRDFSNNIPIIGGQLTGLSGALGAAAVGVGVLTAAYVAGLKEAEAFAQGARALQATLDATGNKTGFLASQLVAFAEEAEGRLAIPAEDILKTQAALATFDGVAGPIFKRTIEAAADLSAVFGGDLAGNSEKLGIVLQNLANGNVEGLARGFKFLGTESISLIENLAKTGQTAQAQEALLAELEKRIGGQGEAAAGGLTGATFRLKDAWGDLLRAFGEGESGQVAISLIDNLALKVASLRPGLQNALIAFNALKNGGDATEAVRNAMIDARLAETGNLADFGLAVAPSVPKRSPAAAASADPVKRTTAVAAAERQRNDAMRAAEKARETALDRELDLLQKQADAAQQLLDVTQRLNADGGALVSFPQASGRKPGDNFEGPDLAGLQRDAQRTAEAAGLVARKFEDDGIQAAQAIAQAFGGKVGNEVSKVAGVLRGLGTGDFNSVGGQSGGILSLVFGKGSESGKALKKAFDPLLDGLEDTFDDFGKALGLDGAGGLLGSAAAGAGLGSLVGGGTEGAIGGAIGGVAGQALGSAVGGPLGGAIGQVLGSVLGGTIGGLFKQPKKGSVSLSGVGGDVSLGAATGNSESRRANAQTLGGSVADSLRNIADQLGGSIGSFSVSVGQRDDKFSVDPTGRGMVSKKYGAKQFDTADEAARFAIQDALQDGALTGVSDTVRRAVTNASSIEKGLSDALTIQSISNRLKAFESPVAAAVEAVDKEFRALEKTLKAAGGSAEELADLQKLYDRERDAAVEQSLATLRDFSDSLKVGSGSPLSLDVQRATAEATFAALEADIRAGREVDQGKFVNAGQNLLDVERQISGGTEGFFSVFNRVQSATQQAIDKISNAIPIRDTFAERTAAASEATSATNGEILNATNQTNALLSQIAASMQAAGGGFVGGDAAARGFARAA
jgi:hypothetical protein